MEKNKETKVGSQFYKEKGLKSVTVHLEPEALKKLRILAIKKERSLQEVVREILNKAVAKE
jgi:hypothetical protein